MLELQELYQTYAFKDDHPHGSVGEAGAGALPNMDHYLIPMRQLISRTYENPIKWYFVVFKPYNQTYSKKYDWYQSKGIDWCRKLVKAKGYIYTRELLADKTHINAIIASDSPPSHNSDLGNKYKLYVTELFSRPDRERVLNYITKESLSRPYIKWQDYIISK